MAIGITNYVGYLTITVFRHYIQCFGRMGLLDLKVPVLELDQSSNRAYKEFSWMGHDRLAVGNSILQFLPEFLWMEEHCLSFIGNRIREEGDGINYALGGNIKLFSWVNCCVGRQRVGIVA